MIKSQQIAAAGAAIVLLLNDPVDANEKAAKLGAYLYANDLVRALAESRCSYLVGKRPLDEFELFAKARPHLSRDEQNEVLRILQGPQWAKKKSESNAFVSGMLAALLKSGEIDLRTACGIVFGTISQVIGKANTEWRNYLSNSSKRR